VKVLIVSVEPPDGPSSYLRLNNPLGLLPSVEVRRALENNGAELVFHHEWLEWADIIVTQRGLPRPGWQRLLNMVMSADKPVVYETDDCLPQVPECLHKPHYRDWGASIHAWAGRVHAVTVSTQALKDYFAPYARRIHVLPNYLSAQTHPADLCVAPKVEPQFVEIGYVGNPDHRADLALVAEPLKRILERRPEVRLTFVGAVPDALVGQDRVRIMKPDFRYDRFAGNLASLGLDLALAPLKSILFNDCRSNIKYLDYCSLGIPTVFSRSPAYECVRQGETGFLCGESPEEWETAIDTLCSDTDLRRRIGSAARHDVRSNWMVEKHAHCWGELYESLAGRDALAA
jgi:glycosyltransferase involved in cell wall biosynthesis